MLSLIPSEDGISLAKFEDALFTTDNCAAASKVRRLTEEYLNSNSQPCWDHFRNTWVHNVEEETNVYLRPVLRNLLDKCGDKLHVKMLFGAICRAFDKEFSLSCNYRKGFGENFIVYMIEHHPTFPLYHVVRCRGARFDVILDCSVPMYMNRPVCVEYLDYCFKMIGDKKENVLMRNLWCRFLPILSVAHFAQKVT